MQELKVAQLSSPQNEREGREAGMDQAPRGGWSSAKCSASNCNWGAFDWSERPSARVDTVRQPKLQGKVRTSPPSQSVQSCAAWSSPKAAPPSPSTLVRIDSH